MEQDDGVADSVAEDDIRRKRMSTLEVLFREAVCPATLPDDDEGDEALERVLKVSDRLMINGTTSVKRLSKTALSRMSLSGRQTSVPQEDDDAADAKPRRKSVPPPPPPPIANDSQDVQEAKEAAARRRASSSVAAVSATTSASGAEPM